MTIWAPVVAALGASLLTGGFTWGVSWWQERRRERAASLKERAAAYHQLISRSLSFTSRARVLRQLMQSRSGIKEGVDVTLGLRRPVDLLELHDWIANDFGPMNDAWSKIQIVGGAEAIDAATELLDACADLIGIATAPGDAHGKVASAVKGVAWTTQQQESLQAATKRVVEDREVFIKVARKELGEEPLVLPLERTAHTDSTASADS